MSTITTLADGATGLVQRTEINTNFTNLNTDKAELSGATFTGDIIVPAEAYGAGWNGSNEVPTKNDLYDKIETIGGDALTTNPLSQFASTTSLELKNTISDETGSGALVFANSPTLVTPALGAATATSINGATITSGTLNGSVTGTNTGDNSANTTSDAYALTTPDFYKYSIVTSEASGNLTVALKNFEGNDPTATKPVKIQIGGVIRTITSALTLTSNASQNYLNLGSAELATKEVDLFVYARWDTGANAVCLDVSRYPNATVTGDFVQSGLSEKGYLVSSFAGSPTTDKEQNIGRFNATLSAGAGYTWSIGTSLILNQPTLQTRYLDYVPVGVGYTAGGARYRIDGNSMNIIIDSTANITGNITVPFTCTNTVDNQMTTNAGTAVLLKNTTTITVATNPQKITGFYGI